MNITTITCTGDRPEAFAICESFLKRQTVRPAQMLVLDDGETPTKTTLSQDYFYWPEYKGRGSLVKKIRRALADGLIKGDAIVFVEDDDYISDDCIEWHIAGLKQFSLFGEGRALYYNVHRRFWFEHTNLKHASLCATSLTKALYPWLTKQCQISDEPFLDVRLWNNAPMSAKVADPYDHPTRKRRSVGIKAMPGRTGYGGGHRGRDRSAVSDADLSKLRSLIGGDAEIYAPFYEPDAAPLPPERNGHIAKPLPSIPNMQNHIARSEAGRVHGENWNNWLAELRGKRVHGLEIGTFEGDSAEWMLENVFTHPDSRYHCVDPFTGSVEHHLGQINVSKLEETTRVKLARFPNVVIHKGYSENELRGMKPRSLDVIYVDGDHSARNAIRDSVLGFELLKVGGIMIWDDYRWAVMPNEVDRPKLGIDSFLKCYLKQMRIMEPRGWQIAAVKIAE